MSILRCGRVVDVLDAGLAEAELGFAEVTRQALVPAVHPLGIDEQREALVEAELGHLRLGLLLLPGSGQGMELELHELLERRFVEHQGLLRVHS